MRHSTLSRYYGDRALDFITHRLAKSLFEEKIQIGRMQKPEDVAQAVVYFCQADNVTATAHNVDGGFGPD